MALEINKESCEETFQVDQWHENAHGQLLINVFIKFSCLWLGYGVHVMAARVL